MTQQNNNLDTQQQTASAASKEISLEDTQKLSQEEMRSRYLEQQRRLACPGCGEEPFLG